MTICLWCHTRFYSPVRWANLWKLDEPEGFCARCLKRLDKINSDSCCKSCGRPLDNLAPRFVDNGVCFDCREWETGPWGGIFHQNRSLYRYNEFMKEVITRFKFRGDAVLAKAFGQALADLYQRHFKGYIPVPIPLSAERLNERFFNQAELLAQTINVPIIKMLKRSRHDPKQSKKSREERLMIQDPPYKLNADYPEYKSKSFVLIDDIYTTGATVRQAALALAPLHPQAVASLTLVRG